MQKYLIYVLLVLTPVALSAVLTNYLVDKRLANQDTPKVIALDMTDFIDQLSEQTDSTEAVLAASQNVLKYLAHEGYLVIDKTSVLSSARQYTLPSINIRRVEQAMRANGIPLVTQEAITERMDNARAMVIRDFSPIPQEGN